MDGVGHSVALHVAARQGINHHVHVAGAVFHRKVEPEDLAGVGGTGIVSSVLTTFELPLFLGLFHLLGHSLGTSL